MYSRRYEAYRPYHPEQHPSYRAPSQSQTRPVEPTYRPQHVQQHLDPHGDPNKSTTHVQQNQDHAKPSHTKVAQAYGVQLAYGKGDTAAPNGAKVNGHDGHDKHTAGNHRATTTSMDGGGKVSRHSDHEFTKNDKGHTSGNGDVPSGKTVDDQPTFGSEALSFLKGGWNSVSDTFTGAWDALKPAREYTQANYLEGHESELQLKYGLPSTHPSTQDLEKAQALLKNSAKLWNQDLQGLAYAAKHPVKTWDALITNLDKIAQDFNK